MATIWTTAEGAVNRRPALPGAAPYTSPMPGASDLELLVSWTMPYGKYKGRRLADLPGHYLNWFARSGFPEGELGRLLALMQEIDHNGLRPLLAPLMERRPGNRNL